MREKMNIFLKKWNEIVAMENRQHGVNIEAENYENFFIGGIANNGTRVKISSFIKTCTTKFLKMQRHIIIFSKGIPVYAKNHRVCFK